MLNIYSWVFKYKKSSGFLNTALSKASEVGSKVGSVVNKGTTSLKSAAVMSSEVQGASAEIKNFEQGQKDRIKSLESIDDE